MVSKSFFTQRFHLPILTFIVISMATLVVTFYFERTEAKHNNLRQSVKLDEAASIVKEAATSVHEPVASLASILSAYYNQGLKRKTEFYHHFIQSRQLLEKHPSVIAWAYAPRLEFETYKQELKAINKSPGRQKIGYGEILVFPTISGSNHLAPVTMIEPKAIIPQVVGFNILSSTQRREAAERAVETGLPQISERAIMRTDAPGVVIYFPIYKTPETPPTVALRRENHIGYMMAAYTTQSLFHTLKEQFKNLSLEVDIHDYGAISSTTRPKLSIATLLSSTNGQHGVIDKSQENKLIPLSSDYNNYRDIEVAGRIWRIVAYDKSNYHAYALHWAAIIITGLSLALLASMLIHTQQNAAVILSARISERTKALRKTKHELQKSRDLAELQALTDPLTGLSNRRALIQAFDEKVHSENGNKENIAILNFDIDFFKSINDNHGHNFGDKVLKTFADFSKVKLSDIYHCFARMGGDEFAMLIASPADKTCPYTSAAETLLSTISEVGQEMNMPNLSASIGIALLEDENETLSDIFKNADLALYEAKNSGRNCAVKYTKAMGAKEKKRKLVLKDCDRGLEADEFIPFFHPFISLEDNKIIGFEILARWQHPKKGLLNPGAFWEALLDDSYATRISNMVLMKALKQAGELKKKGFEVGALGINATEQMLTERNFAKRLVSTAISCGLKAENVKIEVTERILLSRNNNEIMNTLEKLSIYGVKIAFDDFGTGYASLTHLRSFPIDYVKIDRSFVHEIEQDYKSRAIVSAICQMSHDLGFEVIAEGIEKETQSELLWNLKCDIGQGFLYGKPMPVDNVEELLAKHKNTIAA